MTAMSVLGEIELDALGTVQMHEHILVDADFDGNDYNLVTDDVEVAVEEVKYFRAAGGDTIVEQSCMGLGRDAAGLKHVAEQTGVNIIACTGFYRECSHPDYVASETAEQLAERMIQEFKVGIGDTGIRPGILAEIATEHDVGKMSPMEEKVFTAIAYAQTESHVPVSTHCWAGELAFEQIDVLTRNGVPPNKILIGHLAVDEQVKDRIFKIADTGVYLGIDCIGYEYERVVAMKDAGKVKFAKELIDRGFLGQIMMSQDLLRKLYLKHYHGHGYDYLLTQFSPMLAAAGVERQDIETILRRNPRNIFS